MKPPRLLLAVLVLIISGCRFDPSTSSPLDADSPPEQGGEPLSCSGFVGQACGECGIQVCEEKPRGRVVRCSEAPGGCHRGEPGNGCISGMTRDCEECGRETCVNGSWSDNCVPAQDRCDPELRCLPGPGGPSCEYGCSTEGHRTPNEDPIPDAVEVGEEWSSLDGCDFGEHLHCYCDTDFDGDPEVDCDDECHFGS